MSVSSFCITPPSMGNNPLQNFLRYDNLALCHSGCNGIAEEHHYYQHECGFMGYPGLARLQGIGRHGSEEAYHDKVKQTSSHLYPRDERGGRKRVDSAGRA
jgi:hypothetical protein